MRDNPTGEETEHGFNDEPDAFGPANHGPLVNQCRPCGHAHITNRAAHNAHTRLQLATLLCQPQTRAMCLERATRSARSDRLESPQTRTVPVRPVFPALTVLLMFLFARSLCCAPRHAVRCSVIIAPVFPASACLSCAPVFPALVLTAHCAHARSLPSAPLFRARSPCSPRSLSCSPVCTSLCMHSSHCSVPLHALTVLTVLTVLCSRVFPTRSHGVHCTLTAHCAHCPVPHTLTVHCPVLPCMQLTVLAVPTVLDPAARTVLTVMCT
jgi:hypothetical protein